MSTEKGSGEITQKTAPQRPNTTEKSTPQTPSIHSEKQSPSTHQQGPSDDTTETGDKKPPATRKPESKSETTTTSPETPDDPRSRPRQVIAVSASKGPAAFFNLARKFLVTDEMCDLSALEGAIVSAADAAHLLERSKLATIVKVETSYVTVEPKRRRRGAPSPQQGTSAAPQHPPPPPPPHSPMMAAAAAAPPPFDPSSPASLQATPRGGRGSSGRELRRARIVITVKRTETYKQWLENNPLQAVIAGDGDEDEEVEGVEAAAAIDVDSPRQNR